ncbi:MAG: magnesium transporter, partial [Beijerinckiaceae bacterium]
MTDPRHEPDPAEALVEDSEAPAKEELSPINDEEGNIRPQFVAAVEAAIEAENQEELRQLAGDLHEADLASLLEALPPELRPKLIALLGRDFDFAALIELDARIRDEICQELPTQVLAEGMSALEADDALILLEDLDKHEQAEILEALPAVERAALERSLEYAEDSAGRLMQT